MSQNRSVGWRDLFPFSPYETQERGIEEAIDVLSDQGYYVLEGPCGTGKTLISLTAALSMVRNPTTQFERVFVITSRKQQVRAFEDDLETINSHLSGEQYSSLTLVGKADLCPYVQAGDVGAREIYHECLSLRDNTRDLIDDQLTHTNSESSEEAAGDLVSQAEAGTGGRHEWSFTVGDSESPYQRGLPTKRGVDYCPFFAQHLELKKADARVLDPVGVQTASDVFDAGVQAGSCPHAEMKEIHSEVDVLIGNYKHVFDPTTVEAFTAGVIGEETILICDEAHGIVPEVRSQLSYDTTFGTFDQSISDLAMVGNWIHNSQQYPERASIAEQILEMCEVEKHELSGAIQFLTDVRDAIAKIINHDLRTEFGSQWMQRIGSVDREQRSISLQDPEEPETDSLQLWAENNDREDHWKRTITLAKIVGSIQQAVEQRVENSSPSGDYPIEEVGKLLERWFYGSHTEYFREITLRPLEQPSGPTDDRPWRAGYYATLNVHNCIPQDEIAATLDELGGGILMSATLNPVEVYKEVSGTSKLRAGEQPEYGLVSRAIENSGKRDTVGEEDATGEIDEDDVPSSTEESDQSQRGRAVKTSSFDLSFPTENRASFAIKAPKFTYTNRWPPQQNQQLRSTYANVLSVVASTTPGNVLVCMPSYTEAEWAAKRLDQDSYVQKPILIDESGSDSATERLKDEFFNGQANVLTTSLRGTLTEGVDFEGDKLKAVVICGVPITDTSSDLSTAIRTAYEVRFGRNKGFEYAFAVPAVQKARQAIGRVIRGSDDVGVRVLVDERYASTSGFSSVRSLFPEHQQSEFTPTKPDDLQYQLQQFWQQR